MHGEIYFHLNAEHILADFSIRSKLVAERVSVVVGVLFSQIFTNQTYSIKHACTYPDSHPHIANSSCLKKIYPVRMFLPVRMPQIKNSMQPIPTQSFMNLQRCKERGQHDSTSHAIMSRQSSAIHAVHQEKSPKTCHQVATVNLEVNSS